ncbi:hypothetical protein D030_2428A, partial [Vibrio parahaemolyticus AQ3810]
MHPPLW